MTNKCTCVYATSANTESVRKGYELGGYLKEECDYCKRQNKEVWNIPKRSLPESWSLEDAQNVAIEECAKTLEAEISSELSQLNIDAVAALKHAAFKIRLLKRNK